jgi:hypothetical protein
MIKSAESRRNGMLREIDYHRGGLATRLRDAPDVVDAESEDVPASVQSLKTLRRLDRYERRAMARRRRGLCDLRNLPIEH